MMLSLCMQDKYFYKCKSYADWYSEYFNKLETEKVKQQPQATLTNLNISDEEFVHNVHYDIEFFLKNHRVSNSVLLFPPVNNYRRYLIHSTCENYRQEHDLFTFSIGRGPWRRTVICFKSQFLDPFISSTFGSASSKESRLKYQTRSWRSDPKKEHLQSAVSLSSLASSKMGVDKSISNETTRSTSSRCTKSIFENIYRPPALRFQSQESSDRISFTNNRSDERAKTTSIISSISCNNSPTHLNEDKKLLNTLNPQTVKDTSDPNAASLSIEQDSQSHKHLKIATDTAVVNRRQRRPDRAVYIPRARRSQTTPPATTQSQSISTLTESNIVSNEQQFPNNSNACNSVSMASPPKMDESRKKSSTKILKSFNGNTRDRKERTKKKDSEQHKIADNVILEESLSPEKKAKDKNNIDFGINSENNINSEPIGIRKNLKNNCSTNVELFNLEISNDDSVQPCTVLGTEKIKSHIDESTYNYSNLHIKDIISTERITDKCDIEQQELQKASMEINRSNRRIMKQTFISDILEIPEIIHNNKNVDKTVISCSNNVVTTDDEEEDDWENMYDETGECLDPKLIEELTASVGKVKIELPKMDYSAYLTKQSILNSEEFPHVLEVSNFPVEFKNQDLMMVFAQYKGSGFDIKWVDDTHALAIFSSSQIAAEVLTMGHPFVALKPLAEATIESRLKAKKCAASLQPYRPRPETCAALARRLVTGALGVKLKTAAAERENEKRVLREAKERKLLAAKQREEIWES